MIFTYRQIVLLMFAGALLGFAMVCLHAIAATDCDIPIGESCATDSQCECLYGPDQ